MKKNKKIKVGLLVEEFFSNSIPIYACNGGYGMLARNSSCKYIPTNDIQIDVIIGLNDQDTIRIEKVDDTNIIYLPKISPKSFTQKVKNKVFNKQKEVVKSIIDSFDIFLSIEFTTITYFVMQHASKNQKLIFWIQDPRPQSDWDELDTLALSKQNGYRPNKFISTIINKLYNENRLISITQGQCLINKAIDLYQLPPNYTAKFVPNPINIPYITQEEVKNKKNYIVSLGRIDSVKRTWIIAETAKRMPNYEFYFMGQIHELPMHDIMKPYLSLKNCHFVGHLEGQDKDKLLRESKILINTSIHEAIPISFLEAMSYGTLIVSNRNPDNLTEKFGINIEQVNGDGYDSVGKFEDAINQIMNNPQYFNSLSQKAIEYINKVHNTNDFITTIRNIIRNNA